MTLALARRVSVVRLAFAFALLPGLPLLRIQTLLH
jgi:hypothetical protein